MKRILIILFLFSNLLCFAQYDIEEVEKDTTEKEKKVNPFNLKQRTYVGSELSVRFGTITYLYIAPFVGFDIIKESGLSGGVSTMYQLYRENYNGTIYSDHSYGGGLFLRYRPLDPLLIQTEFDIYNTMDYSNYGTRINVPAFMAGLGYAGSLGDRAYYQLMLMYDFIDDPNMPLGSISNFLPLYLRYGFVYYLG